MTATIIGLHMPISPIALFDMDNLNGLAQLFPTYEERFTDPILYSYTYKCIESNSALDD